MARKTAEELVSAIRTAVGDENLSDDVLGIIEDVTDSVVEVDQSAMKEQIRSELEEEYKARLDDLDGQWRRRYAERFTTPTEVIEEQKEDVEDDSEEMTFEDLFEEREG